MKIQELFTCLCLVWNTGNQMSEEIGAGRGVVLWSPQGTVLSTMLLCMILKAQTDLRMMFYIKPAAKNEEA